MSKCAPGGGILAKRKSGTRATRSFYASGIAGIVKESHISLAAEFLLRHLVFFFVPIAVGLMQWGSVFYDYGWVLAAAIVGSTALPLVIVGFMARGLRRRTDKKAALDKEEAPCRS